MFELCKEVKVYNIEYNYYLPHEKEPFTSDHVQSQEHRPEKSHEKLNELPKRKKWLHLSMKELQLQSMSYKLHPQPKNNSKINAQCLQNSQKIHMRQKPFKSKESQMRKLSTDNLEQYTATKNKINYNPEICELESSAKTEKKYDKNNKQEMESLCKPKYKLQFQPFSNPTDKMEIIDYYVQKPLTKSIIMQNEVDVEKGFEEHIRIEENESPIKKLKKRMEINRITSVFEKETMVSKESRLPGERDQEIVIESALLLRDIKSQFTILTSYRESYLMKDERKVLYRCCLGYEKWMGMVISIKEITATEVYLISEELLIYRELEQNKTYLPTVLQLLKSGISAENYTFVKEPYTETLKEYLSNSNCDCWQLTHEVTTLVCILLETMNKYSMYVQRYITINDIVSTVGVLKVHNLDLFTLQKEKEINPKVVIDKLEHEIVSLLKTLRKQQI